MEPALMLGVNPHKLRIKHPDPIGKMLRGTLAGRYGLQIWAWRYWVFNNSSVNNLQLFLLTLSMLFNLLEVQVSHLWHWERERWGRVDDFSVSQTLLLLLVCNAYLFFRERETEHEQGRGKERGRHRLRSRLQAPSCQHRVLGGARTHVLWDHDLSWSGTLDWLSHPSTPQTLVIYMPHILYRGHGHDPWTHTTWLLILAPLNSSSVTSVKCFYFLICKMKIAVRNT